MHIDDLIYKLNEFWGEYRKVKSGLVGLALLVLFILVMIFEGVLSPFPEANKRWRDITYWEDNAKSAYPVWVNYIRNEKLPVTINDLQSTSEEEQKKRMLVKSSTFEYEFDYSSAPGDIILHFDSKGRIINNVYIERPDGKEVKILKKSYKGDKVISSRISLKNSSMDSAYKFASKIDYEGSKNIEKETLDPMTVLFSEAEEGMLTEKKILKGNYKIRIETLIPKNEGEINNIEIKVIGKASGLMGTDSFKRDVFSGLVAGLKWALLIGFMTSAISVTIGVIYGIMSAYFGGWVDGVMQRILEFFINIPFLPLLIVMAAVFKPSIWILIIMMCALNWTGSVRTVRSIGMQIKQETYIEASRALGASHARLIFKHMIPLLVPYSFATMALSVPAAILIEASMSVLGLGDATIVTWGQMLQDARSAGAVIQGIWWWVIPPGLMISLVGMSFAFIGFSMDKILMPKLKTR